MCSCWRRGSFATRSKTSRAEFIGGGGTAEDVRRLMKPGAPTNKPNPTVQLEMSNDGARLFSVDEREYRIRGLSLAASHRERHRQRRSSSRSFKDHSGGFEETKVMAKGFSGFTSVGESLKRHWSSRDVDINAGVSKAQLDSFESKHCVVLPEDLRDYFLCVNGMPHDVVDDGMIRFWMLEELQPLTQGAPAFPMQATFSIRNLCSYLRTTVFGLMLMRFALEVFLCSHTK